MSDALMHLERRDAVVVLHLTAGENVFSMDFLDALDAALDEVEEIEDPVALVVTGQGKFFSNGLDLAYLGSGEADLPSYVKRVQERVFARVLTLPIPTAAALNGHTFAAGAMLSLCCDFRVMREDRGFWCLPEADINIPFTPGMNALIANKLTNQARIRTMVWGERLPAPTALELGVVDAVAPEDAVLDAAVELVAGRVGKLPQTIGVIKRRLHRDTLRELHRDDQIQPRDEA